MAYRYRRGVVAAIWSCHSGREQSERTRDTEIPGSRFARPGMTLEKFPD
jgi:hypothetical protein